MTRDKKRKAIPVTKKINIKTISGKSVIILSSHINYFAVTVIILIISWQLVFIIVNAVRFAVVQLERLCLLIKRFVFCDLRFGNETRTMVVKFYCLIIFIGRN